MQAFVICSYQSNFIIHNYATPQIFNPINLILKIILCAYVYVCVHIFVVGVCIVSVCVCVGGGGGCVCTNLKS